MKKKLNFYFLVLIGLFSAVISLLNPLTIYAGDGVININDVLLLTRYLGRDQTHSDFDAYFDFNNDNIIDINDYVILMNSFNSFNGDANYSARLDIYPRVAEEQLADIKDTSVQSGYNIELLTDFILSFDTEMEELNDIKQLPVISEPIFLNHKNYWRVKKIFLKIKFPTSNIEFSDDNKLVIISDNVKNIDNYKRIINFIDINEKLKISDLQTFLKTYQLPKKEKFIKINSWIIYAEDAVLNISQEFIQSKISGITFNLKAIKISEFIELMNRRMNTFYRLTQNIDDDTMTLLSLTEIQFRYFPEIFGAVLNQLGYRINLNRIEKKSGLGYRNKNKELIIFEYNNEIENFEEKIKLLEDENTNFYVFKSDNICLLQTLPQTALELSEKWEQLKKIMLRPHLNKYLLYQYKTQFVFPQIMPIISSDKTANIEILKNINSIESEIFVCPLVYNNSLLIAHPAEIKNYIESIIRSIDRDERDRTLENEFNYIHQLIYNNALETAEFLNKLYSKNINDTITIVAAEKTNSVIIKTPNKKRLEDIKKTILKIDERPEQVLIKVLIAEVKINDAERFGFEWKIGDKNQQGGFEANIRSNDIAMAMPLEGLKYSLLNSNKFDMFFNLFAQQTNINILSKPHIMTKNNSPARILIGKEVPIVKILNSNTNSDNNSQKLNTADNTNQSLIINQRLSNIPELATEYKEVGISLDVTPFIGADGVVMLDIKQIVSEIEEASSLLNNPVIKKREASTNVIVNNNHTVVIGGMIKKDKINTTKKVPGLSKIPLLGKYLFTYNDESESSNELLIFITPVIMPKNLQQLPVDDLQYNEIKTIEKNNN